MTEIKSMLETNEQKIKEINQLIEKESDLSKKNSLLDFKNYLLEEKNKIIDLKDKIDNIINNNTKQNYDNTSTQKLKTIKRKSSNIYEYEKEYDSDDQNYGILKGPKGEVKKIYKKRVLNSSKNLKEINEPNTEKKENQNLEKNKIFNKKEKKILNSKTKILNLKKSIMIK